MIAHAVRNALGRTAALFYELERRGGPIPDGPLLITANHPNALLDPLVVFRIAHRHARPLAKAPLFEHPLIGPFLRILGGLPVYRRQDDAALMANNDRTFDAAVASLHAGEAIQIYPEGQSHSGPSLTPLRTGAARIALRAEADAGWKLGLRVLPLGLTYTRKPFFRGRAIAVVGDAFAIADLRGRYEIEPQEAVRELTAEITRRLEAVTLNLSRSEDMELIDSAERLYARERGHAGWREREGLGERLPRLRRFAAGLAWLRAHDPARHDRLTRAVQSYRRTTHRLGAGEEADVPPGYQPATVGRYVVTDILPLALGLPLAILGTAAWLLPYLAPRPVVALVRPPHDGIATWKLSAAVIAFPAMWLIWIALAAWLGGAVWALAAAVALPALGVFAVAWFDRWSRVREDAALFLRVGHRSDLLERLARERRMIADEIDHIAEEVEPWT
ncbi:MAG TPA: 1-acyl-sn-glycerol-3-phosphate acyltransferase [Longimicrobiales bacterium]|nr:1-acyl-sn-glycerol-3-phosphate acyltransferase [Longimicrobiales bacterium]